MSTNNDSSKAAPAHVRVSAADLAQWGAGFIAYVKPVEGEGAYAIHGADGRELGIAIGREVAFAAARQNGLEPVSVH